MIESKALVHAGNVTIIYLVSPFRLNMETSASWQYMKFRWCKYHQAFLEQNNPIYIFQFDILPPLPMKLEHCISSLAFPVHIHIGSL